MADLLSRFDEVGPNKAKTRAENHKKRYVSQYFSKKDITIAINKLKRTTVSFFLKFKFQKPAVT